ncbi:unnamed protein product [Phyllotreta striolata]|uniref:Uncharacterized protein n=1 Tax=Phyllotreta striolata TaxID=444603 RepID=A0A9N9XS02_PHYSR|nr:unnamed protein product [Phyllotreta striolata]
MKSQKFLHLMVVIIVIALCSQEVECRRKILMGRKTINRTYLRGMAVPAYVLIILVGIGQIILGAIMYIVLRKVIISRPISGSYSVAPTSEP